jgi:hypothetical protein
MGISAVQLQHLAPFCNGARVLSLGYPDILIVDPDMPEAPRSRHNRASKDSALFDTVAMFKRLGAVSIDCVDFFPSPEFGERFVDLNVPLPPEEAERRYDLVVDPGTTEHCVNVFQALQNAANYVAEGGFISHFMCSDGYLNHGFYQLQPTLFQDYYTENGWKVAVSAEMIMGNKPLGVHHFSEGHAHSRRSRGAELTYVMTWAVARRLVGASTDKMPVQSKYQVKSCT